jgi:hypothetical protein
LKPAKFYFRTAIVLIGPVEKNEIEDMDGIVKAILGSENQHGRQTSAERLLKRTEEGRGLESFKDVYKETKVRN